MLVSALTLCTSAALALCPPQRSRHDVTSYGVVYVVPGMEKVHVVSDVKYCQDGERALHMDLYYPSKPKNGQKWPAVFFVNGVGDWDGPDGKLKNWEIYKSWARLVAAHDLVGITMEANGEHPGDSVSALLQHVKENGQKLFIDGDALGAYAASANVHAALPVLMSSAAQSVRAAVLYYGSGQVDQIRCDLQVYFAIAGKDGAQFVAESKSLFDRAMQQGAPWQFAFGPNLPHAFDALDTSDSSRRLVKQSVEFLVTQLKSVPQVRDPENPARRALAHLYAHEPARALELYQQMSAEDPRDARARVQWANCLMDLGRPSEAIEQLQQALALGLDEPYIHRSLGMVLAQAARHDEAVPHLQEAVDAGPPDSSLLGALAHSQIFCKLYGDAIENYEEAFRVGIRRGANTSGVAYYNLCCAYALFGKKEEAFDQLSKAVEDGYRNGNQIRSDPDLQNLRSDPRYAEILKTIGGRAP